MNSNLEALSTEIETHLRENGFAIFHGFPRAYDDVAAVYWNTSGHPDYRDFIAAAQSAGVKLVTLYANNFDEAVIDDAIERLDDPGIPRDERRSIEKRLRELRAYSGFICQIELSFDLAPRVYIFDLRTEWFDELNELLDSIDDAYEESEPTDPSPGNYFSQN
ncbi:MAG TPA: hypothetical protein VKS01_09070 [Bryobacteraceae bacterium]|nr:hypothetical protein [Bryobacteraceae bacterium]